MGTWGTGNFDNDDALDFIETDVYEPLIDVLEEMVDEPSLAGPDDRGPEIVAAVEIMAVLSERFPVSPPLAEQIQEWKEIFMENWEKESDSLPFDAPWIGERKSIIEKTFDQLINVSEDFYREEEKDDGEEKE